ncbi:hypothetical protein HDA32_002122 [Spinactinospora alkalitolerans]|uniref:Secreted protein n=1 Tax=Spinactinospora alkalitolerans TaxID=687207 RepID=A0A852TVW1_9ACTN|nr:hypothetical protein [Spinactinospora alkalitolerans]NYE47002.1 hypothetical protein [Spinactinospora alkalitolerans]
MPIGSSTRRRSARLALAAAAAAATLTAVASTAAAADDAPAEERQHIATTTLGQDLKVTLTAVRAGEYEADVVLTAHRFTDGRWQTVDRAAVGDTWFWYPLTGRGAVCELAVGNRPGEQPTVDVSLLQSPSLGCSQTYRIVVDG